MASYPEWLTAKQLTNTASSLELYLQDVRTEGWRSEFKAATNNADFGVREAVSAFANARGGEVFVGVANSGSVDGSIVTLENLNQVLRQSGAARGDWYETDLLNVSEVLPVSFPAGAKWAYVIQVRVPDKPVFVFQDGRYLMAVRSGSDSFSTVDSREAMEWFRKWRRGDILRKSHAELSLYLGQLSLHRQLPDGLPDRLPFISKVSEDGTLLSFLTAEDVTTLLGRGVPNGGRAGGVVDLYYGVLGWAKAELARRPIANRFLPLRDLGAASAGYGNLDGEISAKLTTFAAYIQIQGFPCP
jgi:hypothetical protein